MEQRKRQPFALDISDIAILIGAVIAGFSLYQLSVWALVAAAGLAVMILGLRRG